MVRGAACVAGTFPLVVALLLAVSPVDAKTKATFPALSKKNPVCTFGVDQVRVRGTPTDESTPVWWKKSIPCKGPQGYAIQPCQLKACQCRKFHTHVEGTDVATWAECLPGIKDKEGCVGADMRWCDNYLRGKDPLSKGTADKKAEKLAAAEKAELAGNHSDSADEATTKSAASGGAAAPATAASFPALAVVLACVGVLLAVVVGTWLVTSKKKKTKKTAVITAPATKDPQSLEFDDFDDDDHHHKDLYTDAQSTAAAVHTVAEPPIRRMSSASVSSVSSSDDDDDDDEEEDKNQDSWVEYSKK
ncbi:hypothetical protein LEN26_001008 [Aphanomyces euteiches]|nr:hypothetical protein LEN26_001008 [Aphanomyces euteiches]KAH9192888.1 hypothetical protein AeNC1_005125 [Aphanomyces euteiches]